MDVNLINLICAMAPSCLYVQGESCAAPFQVVDIDFEKSCVILKHKTKGKLDGIGCLGFEDDIKPYLRPMSSMTKKELKEYNELYKERENNNEWDDLAQYHELIFWMISKHLDYLHWIEKGIAIEAPKDMYKKLTNN